MPKLNDLTGRRFGKLLVVDRAEDHVYPSERTRVSWNCVCDCGVYSKHLSHNLVKGDSTSCGCYIVESRTKHGRSRDIDYVREKSRLHYIKNKKEILKNMKEYSMGNKERIKEYQLKRASTIEGHSKGILNRIKKKTKDTNLTLEYLVELWNDQKGFCALSGKLMNLKKGNGRTPRSPSLDRINNTKGYYKNNVRWLCDGVNMMKGTLTDVELDEWCIAVVQGLRRQKKEYIPNFSTFSDLIDRMVIDVHKLAFWENFKRQEHSKEKPDIEKIAKADYMSRECCEIRSALKGELNRMLSEIVNSRAYYPIKEIRTFTPAAETIAEIIADVSFESAMKTFEPEFIEAMSKLLEERAK